MQAVQRREGSMIQAIFVRLELEQALIQGKKLIPVYFDQVQSLLSTKNFPLHSAVSHWLKRLKSTSVRDFDHTRFAT